MRFLNRIDAGRQLAGALRGRAQHDAIVIGVTRGGVPVAAELARELDARFDICIISRLTSSTGVSFGCVAEAGGLFIDWARVDSLGLSMEDVDAAVDHTCTSVTRLATLYRDHPRLDVRGQNVILVDDGLASEGPVQAAAHSLRRRDAHFIELAVPVADARVLTEVATEFDHVTALEVDTICATVGGRYQDLPAVAEAEIVDLLAGYTSYLESTRTEGRPYRGAATGEPRRTSTVAPQEDGRAPGSQGR